MLSGLTRLAGVARSRAGTATLLARALPAATATLRATPLSASTGTIRLSALSSSRGYGGSSENFAVLDGKLNTASADYGENMALMDSLVAELEEKVETAKLGGGEKSVTRHESRGKMVARDRIDALVDAGTQHNCCCTAPLPLHPPARARGVSMWCMWC